MATARMAGGNVLGVITDVSATISTVSNTVSNSVSILNDMVNNLKTKREESYISEMISFRDNLKEEATLAAVKREENIRNYIGNDKAKQDVYNNYMKKLDEAYVAYDKKKQQDA